MKDKNRKIWLWRGVIVVLLFASLLAWALLPGVHEFINRSVAAFAAVDQQGIERFIQSYGALAAVVSFLLMILQAIAAPLPAFLITFANASL
ncbi:TVP38/TMEM64 family protein, partial [Escherichia coli]|nr:TVP38/TMEM64 family protein [Escherichia coli]